MTTSKFTTPSNDKRNSLVDSKIKPQRIRNKTVAFFIGGAADKEAYYFQGPYKNIEEAKKYFDPLVADLKELGLYESHYRGYDDARGTNDIKKQFKAHITDKTVSVYLIGHSLGGWNAAHLSAILTKDGYKVEMLITLDPVGEGALVWVGSDIYGSKPVPKANSWINVLASPSKPDQSDGVAEFGERWNVGSGPTVSYTADINHAYAKKMFLAAPKDMKSASTYMFDSITEITK
jgi:pimeloyl-ACP methyl ester carboxylesterase